MLLDFFLDLVEQIKVNNAGENEEIKQENKRLEKEKNDLLLQVWSLFFL